MLTVSYKWIKLMITDQWINGSMDISGYYKYIFLMYRNFRSDQTKGKRYEKAGKTFLEYRPCRMESFWHHIFGSCVITVTLTRNKAGGPMNFWGFSRDQELSFPSREGVSRDRIIIPEGPKASQGLAMWVGWTETWKITVVWKKAQIAPK